MLSCGFHLLVWVFCTSNFSLFVRLLFSLRFLKVTKRERLRFIF